MENPAVDSPRNASLAVEMKQYLEAKLSEDSTLFPYILFSFVCEKSKDGVFWGPPLTQELVQIYVKRCRTKHRDDTVKSVIDFCRANFYNGQSSETRSSTDLLIFCDIEEDVDNNGHYSTSIGDGSDNQPLRVGLTSYGLLEVYLAVQCDPRATTVLHVDNTVNTSYLVFILGISDPSGIYFPMVYYCSSQRRTQDIVWCLAFIKRVLRERFAATFSPNFVMTDADDAQYNASVDQLPTSCILMCWFHVSQNIKDKTQSLPTITRKMIFRDFNTLGFCTSMREYRTKKDSILSCWSSYYNDFPRFKKIAKQLITQWIQCINPVTRHLEDSRFSKWQFFHSPPGYAVTNSPLEQYHKILKIITNTVRATPIELLQRLDRCRVAFESRNLRSQVVGNDDSESCVSSCGEVVLRNRKIARVLLHTAPELPTNGGGTPIFREVT
ncbi:Hypothetical protein PHPALM_20489 [Phytophthora palmivora]|uniref:MULE transposase domain-containing protein n=1 Tax=Phytophthora palmivora TaxID=4796 RepID=A0A2P4XES4_9STRA|nr:Hypothetical protein PHPALM_20489 [Phytophthora palmivora]